MAFSMLHGHPERTPEMTALLQNVQRVNAQRMEGIVTPQQAGSAVLPHVPPAPEPLAAPVAVPPAPEPLAAPPAPEPPAAPPAAPSAEPPAVVTASAFAPTSPEKVNARRSGADRPEPAKRHQLFSPPAIKTMASLASAAEVDVHEVAELNVADLHELMGEFKVGVFGRRDIAAEHQMYLCHTTYRGGEDDESNTSGESQDYY